VSVIIDTSCDTHSNECAVSVTKGLQPLARSCGAIRKVDVAEMPKELQTIVSEDVEDYAVSGFTHGGPSYVPKRFCLPPCFIDDEDNDTDTSEESPPCFSPESTYSPAVQEPIDEDGAEAILEGQNMGSLAANGRSDQNAQDFSALSKMDGAADDFEDSEASSLDFGLNNQLRTPSPTRLSPNQASDSPLPPHSLLSPPHPTTTLPHPSHHPPTSPTSPLLPLP